MEIVKALSAINFFEYNRVLPDLCRAAELMAASAGDTGAAEQFACYPSFIPAAPPQKRHACVLSFGIGSGSTRAAVRLAETEDRNRWQLLFQTRHHEFQPQLPGGPAFESFCSGIVKKAADALVSLGIHKKSVEACGVAWANPIENKPLENRGIGGAIAYHAQYRKGEWFLAGAKDGYDLGTPLLAALDRSGLRVKRFLICNNGPLIMKALTFAHGGMVASNGINGTLVKEVQGSHKIICNGELGARWKLPAAIVSRADLIDDRRVAENFESVCSTTFMPRLFSQYIVSLERAGCGQFIGLAKKLAELQGGRWSVFSMPDLTNLLYNKPGFLERHGSWCDHSPEAIQGLEDLARELIIRAAKLCAVLAYATICNQIKEQRGATVALDSSLARETPIFLSVLRDTLLEISPSRKNVELLLVEPLALPGGEITVPMLGSANALDTLAK